MATNYSEFILRTAAAKGGAFGSHKIILNSVELKQKRTATSVERERTPQPKRRIRRYVESNLMCRNLSVSIPNEQLTYSRSNSCFTITF